MFRFKFSPIIIFLLTITCVCSAQMSMDYEDPEPTEEYCAEIKQPHLIEYPIKAMQLAYEYGMKELCIEMSDKFYVAFAKLIASNCIKHKESLELMHITLKMNRDFKKKCKELGD